MRFQHLAPLAAAIPSALALSTQRPEFANTTTLPTHFAMMLIPEFQNLDVFGPLDVLNTLAMYYKNATTMHLSIISRSMDPVATTNRTGPGYFGQDILPTTTFKDVLSGGGNCPAAAAKAGAGEGKPDGKPEGKPAGEGQGGAGYGQGTGEVQPGGYGQEKPPSQRRSSGYDVSYVKRNGQPVPADDAAKPNLGEIEVLFVPGGGGTRRDMTEEIAFVKEMYPKLKYIISVCTGATIMARAGILDGKSATTNKRAWKWAVSTGPNVKWVPEARWVEDGNTWSSSGISAGIDVTFAWVAKIYGEEVAEWIAGSMEYERWTDAHRDPFAEMWDVSAVPAGAEPPKPAEPAAGAPPAGAPPAEPAAGAPPAPPAAPAPPAGRV